MIRIVGTGRYDTAGPAVTVRCPSRVNHANPVMLYEPLIAEFFTAGSGLVESVMQSVDASL
jgi:hypothetical protein